MRTAAGVALICVSAITAAGGGGCGDDASDDGSSVTKVEFISKATKICEKAERQKNQKLQAELKKAASSEDGTFGKAGQEELVVAILPLLGQMAAELEDLNAARGNKEAVDEIVRAFQEAVSNLESEPANALDPNADPFGEATTLAGDYGLRACTQF